LDTPKNHLRILLGFFALGGAGCLVASVVVSASGLSEKLTALSIGLGGVSVVLYIVDAWRSGAMGVSMGMAKGPDANDAQEASDVREADDARRATH
jgi:hypothetical protein